MNRYSNINSIVILTGAGISAASGLDTFRDKGGIWTQYDYREVATPQGFARNPDKVHAFYNMRRRQALAVKPNAAHLALARLEREWHGDFLLVTQNVDGLHEAAGSRKLLHKLDCLRLPRDNAGQKRQPIPAGYGQLQVAESVVVILDFMRGFPQHIVGDAFRARKTKDLVERFGRGDEGDESLGVIPDRVVV